MLRSGNHAAIALAPAIARPDRIAAADLLDEAALDKADRKLLEDFRRQAADLGRSLAPSPSRLAPGKRSV